MQPIYMPFTHVSEQAAETIHDLLGPVIVYQPGGLSVPTALSTLVEKGLVEIKVPCDAGDQDVLKSLKQQYHVWADMRSNGRRIDTGAFMAANNSVPFLNEDSMGQIRTELNQIRKGLSPKPEQDALLTARLFLALAQDHDFQQTELAADMSAVSRMESNLMAELKGDGDDGMNIADEPMSTLEDMGRFMTRKRIESWSTLFMADSDRSGIFVTDSQAVVQELCEISNELMAVLDDHQKITLPGGKDGTSVSFALLKDIFGELVSDANPLDLIQKMSSTPQNGELQYRGERHWTLYMAAGITPNKFWGRYAAHNFSQEKDKEKTPHMLNTLVFYLEI